MSGIMQMQFAYKSAARTMRALLSTTGQSAYDAAANDAWFSVSSTDYAAVFSGLSGASKVGMDDATLGGGGTAFSGSFGTTLPQSNVTVASGSYIIGFATKSSAVAAANTNAYVSTTYKGNYSVIGSNVIQLAATASPVYYLRKAAVAQAATSYVAMGPRTSGNWWATGSWTAGGGYSSTLTSGSWSTYTSSLPCQQWLITSSQPY